MNNDLVQRCSAKHRHPWSLVQASRPRKVTDPEGIAVSFCQPGRRRKVGMHWQCLSSVGARSDLALPSLWSEHLHPSPVSSQEIHTSLHCTGHRVFEPRSHSCLFTGWCSIRHFRAKLRQGGGTIRHAACAVKARWFRPARPVHHRNPSKGVLRITKSRRSSVLHSPRAGRRLGTARTTTLEQQQM